MTYRRAVVCPPCYPALDNGPGVAEVGGRLYGLAGPSRGDAESLGPSSSASGTEQFDRYPTNTPLVRTAPNGSSCWSGAVGPARSVADL